MSRRACAPRPRACARCSSHAGTSGTSIDRAKMPRSELEVTELDEVRRSTERDLTLHAGELARVNILRRGGAVNADGHGESEP